MGSTYERNRAAWNEQVRAGNEWTQPFSAETIARARRAAAGAHVTSFDASDEQLAQDRRVAERDGLPLRTVQGDMHDLSVFADASFDLVFNPCSTCFVEDLEPLREEREGMIQLSHTFDAQLGGQLRAGLMITDMFEDSWPDWPALHGVAPAFMATRAVKPERAR